MNVSDFIKDKIKEFKFVDAKPYLELSESKFEKRDDTKLHSEKVAFFAYLIGIKLGLSKKDLEITIISSMLHDIGKTEIETCILCKKKLSEDEFDIIKTHTALGRKLIEDLKEANSKEIAKIIYYHHERIDGNGYYKLTKNEIPLISKIISVADAYDAMRSKREYKEDLPFVDAIKELTDKINTQFDEITVKKLIQILEYFNLNY